LKKLLYIAAGLLISAHICAQENLTPPFLNPTALFHTTEITQSLLAFQFSAGTHRNASGIEGIHLRYTPLKVLGLVFPKTGGEYLGVSFRLNGMYRLSDFGFPGMSFSGEAHIKALYSIGEKNQFFSKTPLISGMGRHNISFGYNGYLTTDSTSQIGGQLDYSYVKDKHAFVMNYENDTMLMYAQDKYRTAAFKISYLSDTKIGIIGASAGFNLWAGERHINLWEIWNNGDIQIPEEVSRNSVVTLYNGKEYSVDVAFFSLIWNNMSMSIGWDSELFKKLIHNNVHYVLNDGALPILERPDRFFIEFKIGNIDDLF